MGEKIKVILDEFEKAVQKEMVYGDFEALEFAKDTAIEKLKQLFKNGV